MKSSSVINNRESNKKFTHKSYIMPVNNELLSSEPFPEDATETNVSTVAPTSTLCSGSNTRSRACINKIEVTS